MKFLFGIIIIVIGFTMVWKTEGWFSFFGRVAFAEKWLGTEGGSRLFYKLLGILGIIIGMLLVTGLYDDVLVSTTAPLIR